MHAAVGKGRTMYFLARVVFYAGKRKFLPISGYRPDAIFCGRNDYWGITFIDLKSENFDAPVLTKIAFTVQDKHYQEIAIDQTFQIMEGARQVGEGKVVFIEK